MPPRFGRPTYGGGRSTYGGGFSLAFPPFTPLVKLLVLINVAVYFLLLFGDIAAPGFSKLFSGIFGFVPLAAVNHFRLWQFITYGFVHARLLHVLFNMLALWMFGSTLESAWRKQKFAEFYFFCLVGAALTTLAAGWIGYGIISGGSESSFWASLANLLRVPTIGASGAVYGILVAFAVLYGEQEIMMFPLPIRMKAKYMVAILVLIVFAASLQPQAGGVANLAHLGGALFGYVYAKSLPRRSLALGASERYFGMRNSYYRWKRRRAARKFEVYMRKQDPSYKDLFDEYGNYRDPSSKDDKDNGGSGPGRWVH